MEAPKFKGEEGKRNRLYAGAGAAAVLVVAFFLLLVLGGDDSKSEPGAPEIVSADSLRGDVSGQDPPVYWAGEQLGTELELSQPEQGRTYVRYLTGGAEAGDSRADFLTVGTYVQANPVAALRRQGSQPGGVISSAPGNATVYFDRRQPHSVYVAYPGVEVEVEVYDPSFTRALQLVNSGQVVPIG
jgi:hypothetical protein